MTIEHIYFTSESAELAADDLVLEHLEGEAGLGRPYRFSLRMRSRSSEGLAPEAIDDLLRMPCAVFYGDARDAIHGRLRWMETTGVDESGIVQYAAELVPAVQMLERSRRSRVFQDVDLPGLVTLVLAESGFAPGVDFEVRTIESYPVSEYVVQYEESDWDFLNRQLEHHGAHYSFEQTEDRAVLSIGDSNDVFRQHATPRVLFERAAGEHDRHGVRAIARRVEPGHASVVLRDYNWRNPMVALQNQAPADQQTGSGFAYFYGEHYKDPADGNRIARLRSEEILSRRETFRAHATLPGLVPGRWFTLEGAPLGELEGEYLVTAMKLRVEAGEGSVPDTISQELALIRRDVTYRPPRRAAKPKIAGFMHAMVDGPMRGTAAPIDEHGRYKVLFPFDLVGRGGGRASRWIRVAQPSSGPDHGVHLPMHVGAEVIVSHLDGDPDRPVIVGSPHNALTINPVASRNPTQSVIKTQAGVRVVIDDDC